MPRNNRDQMEQRRPEPSGMKAQQVRKAKKPMTTGKVVLIAVVVGFVMLLLFSAALIFVSQNTKMMQNAQQLQALSDAQNKVMDSAQTYTFVPVDTLREQTLSASVNLKVTKTLDGQVGNDSATDVMDSSTISANTAANGTGTTQNQNVSNGTAATQQQTATQAPVAQSAGEYANGTVSYGAGVLVGSKDDVFYIATNFHVIQNNTKIIATIGGEDYTAKTVGYDSTSDIAVLAVDAKNLSVAKIGESGKVKVGDFVMSVGNPYGLNDTMTNGNVSGLGRNMSYVDTKTSVMYANMIQINTAINPGNSGGGLYNAVGELIGINTLVTGNDSHAESIGYAIPIDFAKTIIQDIIAGKEASHASLGLKLADVDANTIAKYGLTSSEGAYVTMVTKSGPSEVAGIVVGDIITAYDGETVKDAQDMLYKIRKSVINTQRDITILREGKEMKFQIKVGSDV